MNEQKGDPDAAHVMAGELRILIGKLRRRLREQATPGDLTESQRSVLIRIERDGPATVTNLARSEGVRPQSMGATISVLESAGLVRGAPDPSDGRQTVWSLTADCVQLIKEVRAAKEDWLFRTIQTRLAPGEQEVLARAVELLKRIAEKD